jgi:gas vesicle protein GvpA/GvpJ/GvpM family
VARCSAWQYDTLERNFLPPEDQSLRRPQGLVDVLDKILDKGLVVAGDIKVSLANVELLTIQLRLVICSVDKAQTIGIDWWRRDPFYSGSARRQDAVAAAPAELDELRHRIADLESQLGVPKRVGTGKKPENSKGR